MHLLSSLSWLAVGAGAFHLVDRSHTHKHNCDVRASTSYPDPVPAHSAGGIKTIGYFGNWDIYGAKYFITDIPASKLTHLHYAFGNINNATGEVFLSDPWADLQYAYPGDITNATGTNVYGNIKQLFKLKKKYRHLKTMFAIGGWTYRVNFPLMLASETKRETFAKTALKIVADLGFDGLDIDYEYVDGPEQAAQMVDLLRRLRKGLDDLEVELKSTSRFQLTYAAPAGKDKYTKLDFENMTPLLDFYNFMAVDYMSAGASNHSGHAANLFLDKRNPAATDFDTDSGVQYYLHEAKVPASKLIIQNPLYGRAFAGTRGLGQKFVDEGTEGSLGLNGTWYYKHLPVPGHNATVINDYKVGASYSFDAKRQYLISFDTPEIARLKIAYAKKMKLAGTAWWEVAQDRTDSLSLIDVSIKAYGGEAVLEKTQNNLNYPTSPYDNLRSGLPGV